MVREHGGDGEIAVPPTIQALLQARIDSLDGDVRVVMERGAVEGEVFHRGAVAELSPDRVRDGGRGAPRDARPQGADPLDVAARSPTTRRFRFRHLLIRDAAYESMPKATRAELHERFADWLERRHESRRAGRDRRLPPRAGASATAPELGRRRRALASSPRARRGQLLGCRTRGARLAATSTRPRSPPAACGRRCSRRATDAARG